MLDCVLSGIWHQSTLGAARCWLIRGQARKCSASMPAPTPTRGWHTYGRTASVWDSLNPSVIVFISCTVYKCTVWECYQSCTQGPVPIMIPTREWVNIVSLVPAYRNLRQEAVKYESNISAWKWWNILVYPGGGLKYFKVRIAALLSVLSCWCCSLECRQAVCLHRKQVITIVCSNVATSNGGIKWYLATSLVTPVCFLSI